jgi:hypothetical protein
VTSGVATIMIIINNYIYMSPAIEYGWLLLYQKYSVWPSIKAIKRMLMLCYISLAKLFILLIVI